MVGLQLLLALYYCRPTAFFEGHPHKGRQPLAFLIGLGCCCHAHVHTFGLPESIEPDLWEDALVTDPNAVVPMTVKAVRVHTLEVPSPGKPQVDQPVQQRVHQPELAISLGSHYISMHYAT